MCAVSQMSDGASAQCSDVAYVPQVDMQTAAFLESWCTLLFLAVSGTHCLIQAPCSVHLPAPQHRSLSMCGQARPRELI